MRAVWPPPVPDICEIKQIEMEKDSRAQNDRKHYAVRNNAARLFPQPRIYSENYEQNCKVGSAHPFAVNKA